VQQAGPGKVHRATRAVIGPALLLLVPVVLAAQQRSGTTALAIHVVPEARLTPSQVMLQFHVAADGSASVVTETALIEAWMRPLPHQQIRLAAQLTNFSGPSGPAARDAVSWSGTVASAAGGGQIALCTGGSFQAASILDLASGWESAGKLACSVSFSLTGASNLSPGDYTGTVALTLSAR